jgi:hypothetical protein
MTDYIEKIAKDTGVTIPDPKKFRDTRDPELLEAHKVLGREIFKFETARTRELIKKHPEWKIPVPAAPKPGSEFQYATDVATAGLIFGVTVAMEFYSDNYQTRVEQFVGGGGGLGSYDSISRGTSFFNYSLETLLGWEARFEMNFAPLTVNINLWGMHGEYIGSYIGGGAAAVGVYGGQGKFLPP